MPQNSFSIKSFEAKRVRFDSTRSFDEVLLNLRNLVGTALPQKENKQETFGDEYLAAMQVSGGVSQENFAKVIQSQVGESGFMLFLEPNPALLQAAQELDRKLQKLVSRVTGVELDQTP